MLSQWDCLIVRVSRSSLIHGLDCTLLHKSLFTVFKPFTSLLFQRIVWSLILDEQYRTQEPRAFIHRKMNFFPTHTNRFHQRSLVDLFFSCFINISNALQIYNCPQSFFYPLCVILGECKRVWRNELNTSLVMIVSGKFYPALMWVGSIEVGLIRFCSIGSETLPADHQSFPWINPIAPVNLSIINIRRDVSPPNCFSQFWGGHWPSRYSFWSRNRAVGVWTVSVCMFSMEYLLHCAAQV